MTNILPNSDSQIRMFIGYDPREAAPWNVLAHSIHVRSSRPVSITPLMLSQLGDLVWRERNPLQSTDFSFSRFLVPYLCGYRGWAIFADCDMLFLVDVAKPWDLRDDRYAVLCMKHDHKPTEDTKFLGAMQTRYEKKNWSSVMLYNCAQCTALTPEYVNSADGLELHRFQWLDSDELIGGIPARWKHLVDYDPPLPAGEVSNLHFTTGGPYFKEYRACGHADLWWGERQDMLHCEQPD